ncbi:ADP-ribosylglycohydrolase [Tothia fuscella]|uniref:ADP-ribosylglycohydrolase n=1 Tax=Tothia fuscella TaxID=1048955 RepID=A0A9P4U2N5_9PEZI|nr:ADP-ribosylglycohydrolase [Tothia fuscella]
MDHSKDLNFLTLHPFVTSTVQDKVFGTIFGSALGDTIGLYTELLPATVAASVYPNRNFTLQPPTPYRAESHRDKFDQAAWTDDTDHSLLILLSYLHNKGEIIPNDFAARLAIWTIGTVVRKPNFPKAPFEEALASWLKTGRSNAANGSLMRTHPLGIMCIGFTREQTFRTAAEMSRITHVDPRCVVSCCIQTSLVRDGVIEQSFEWVFTKDELRNPGLEQGLDELVLNGLLDVEEFHRHVYARNFKELELDDSRKMGYVYKCLGSAILSLRLAMREKYSRASTFGRLITDLVMEGGDADNNATAAGALLGAWLGYARLPNDWARGIKHRVWLIKKTGKLIRVVGILEPQNGRDNEEDSDTGLYGGKVPMTDEEVNAMERDLLMKIMEKEKIRREQEGHMAQEKKGIRQWIKSGS